MAIALNDVRFRHIADMIKRTSVNAALMSDEVLKRAREISRKKRATFQRPEHGAPLHSSCFR